MSGKYNMKKTLYIALLISPPCFSDISVSDFAEHNSIEKRPVYKKFAEDLKDRVSFIESKSEGKKTIVKYKTKTSFAPEEEKILKSTFGTTPCSDPLYSKMMANGYSRDIIFYTPSGEVRITADFNACGRKTTPVTRQHILESIESSRGDLPSRMANGNFMTITKRSLGEGLSIEYTVRTDEPHIFSSISDEDFKGAMCQDQYFVSTYTFLGVSLNFNFVDMNNKNVRRLVIKDGGCAKYDYSK